MSNIRRLFVEKKDAFAVEAHGLLADLRNNLGMSNLTGMRIVNRYDVMGLSDEEFAMAKQLVLSEPPVDNVVEEELPLAAGEAAFAVELLPSIRPARGFCRTMYPADYPEGAPDGCCC